MSEEEYREFYIGARVSEEEKKEVEALAKGMNVSVSDLIRLRTLRPIMTTPEALANMKLYFDTKFRKLQENIKELFKEQLFIREPVRRAKIEIEEIIPIRKKEPSTKVIEMMTGIPIEQQILRQNIVKELKEVFKKGESILKKIE